MTLLNFIHWNVAGVSHEGAKTLKNSSSSRPHLGACERHRCPQLQSASSKPLQADRGDFAKIKAVKLGVYADRLGVAMSEEVGDFLERNAFLQESSSARVA